MTTSSLAVRWMDGSYVSVQRYNLSSGALVQCGNSFSTTASYSSQVNAPCFAINVAGEIFAMGTDGIYRKKDPTSNTGDWELMVLYTSPQVLRISGLYLGVNSNGVPTLCAVVGKSTSVSQHCIYTMPLTRPYAWNITEIVSDNGIGVFGDCLFYDNKLWAIGASSTTGATSPVTVIKFDPFAETSYSSQTSTSYSNVLRSCTSIAIVNGRIVVTYPYGSGGTSLRVAEADSLGALETRHTFTGTAFPSRAEILWPQVAGTEDNDFYVFPHIGSNFECHKFTLSGAPGSPGTWTPTDITGTVIPGGFPSGSNGKSFAIVDRVSVIGDVTWQLGFATSTTSVGSAMSFYTWADEFSPMTLISTGGAASDALPRQYAYSSGEYAYAPGELDAEILGSEATNGGVLITFRCHGDPIIISHNPTNSTGGVDDWVEGETIIGGTSNTTATLIRKDPAGDDSILHVGNVSGTGFINGETIYGAVASAVINSAVTGGSTNTSFNLRYIDTTGATQVATLTGSVTGGSASRNGNIVESIVSDGATEYTCIWDFSSDGIGIGKYISVIPQIEIV